MTLLDVVVPVHRNRATVAEVVTRILAAVPEARIVVVDDACPERTAVGLTTLVDRGLAVEVVHHTRNRGQQQAILTGLRHARDGAAVAVLDADLQDPPEALPLLVERLDRGDADAVFAGRRGRYESWWRRASGVAHRWVLAAVLGLPHDAGGYVVLAPSLVAKVLALDGPPQLVAAIGRAAGATVSVPVVRSRRAVGRSASGAVRRFRHGAAGLDHARRHVVGRLRRARPTATDVANDHGHHHAVQLEHYAGAGLVSPRMRPVDSPYVRRHVQRLVDALELRPGDRVLDVGCGLGKFTRLLQDVHGLEVEGLDLSPALLAGFAAERPETILHEADLLDPPEALRGGFDAVTGFFMLHHLPDLPAAFAGVRELLRPAGRCGFVEPNAWCPLFWAQITCCPGLTWRAERGVVRMTRRRLVAALESAGLTSIGLERRGMLPPVLANHPRGAAVDEWVDRAAVLDPVRAFAVVTARAPATR